MSDRAAVRARDAEEREWRERIEGRLSTEHDCVQRAGELMASRRDLETNAASGGSSRRKWVIRSLIVVAIPLIAYSELMTPSGMINYSGMGIGVVLMLAGGLAYL